MSPRRPTASSPPHPAPPAGHPPRPGPRSVCRCPGSPPGRSRRPRSRRGSCCTRRRGSRGWTSSRLRGGGRGEAGPGSSGAPQDRRQLRPRGRRGRRQTRSVRERRRAVRCGTGQPPGVTTPRGRPRVSPATASGCGARPAGLLSPRGAPQGPGAGLTAAPFAHLGLSFPRCVFCVFCAFGQNEGAVATGQAPVAVGGGQAGATHLWGSSSGCTSAALGRPPRRPGRRAAARGCCRRASAPGCLRRR